MSTKFTFKLFTIPTLIFLALIQTGCAGTLRKQIVKDLTQIAEYQDCPSTCEALKFYIKTKLGGL